jgi:hypothetical protein
MNLRLLRISTRVALMPQPLGPTSGYLTIHTIEAFSRRRGIAIDTSAGLPVPSFLRFSSASERCIASAARTARSASFSYATG